MSNYYNRQWRLPNEENKSKVSNYSMDFDGSSYIDAGTDSVSGALSLQGNFTISFWFYTGSFSNGIHVVSRENTSSYGWRVQFDAANIALRANSTTQATKYETPVPSTNQWHHLAFTYDGGTNPLCYIDGQSVTLTQGFSTWFAPPNNSYNFRIGKADGFTGFSGKIDAVSIFNYALSASQVTTLYGSSSTGIGNPMSLSPKPVAHYQIGDKSAFNGANYLAPNIAAEEADGDIATSYSPYALNFDGTDDYISTTALNNFITNNVSVSAWVNYSTLPSSFDGAFLGTQSFSTGLGFYAVSGVIRFAIEGYNTNYVANTVTLSTNQWYHFCGTWNGSTIELFVNGVSQGTDSYSGSITTSNQLFLGRVLNNSYNINGKLSNISIWNAGLTSSQVTEIYNEGVPSNLNNHSAYSNLVSWWQLGSNSSFNTNWTVLDEKGSNNGTSVNMTEDDIVDGVGSYGNGLSSGMGGDEVIGDAPYSTANSLSVNMDVLDRTTDTPS